MLTRVCVMSLKQESQGWIGPGGRCRGVQIRDSFLFLFFSFLPSSLQRLFPFFSGHMYR